MSPSSKRLESDVQQLLLDDLKSGSAEQMPSPSTSVSTIVNEEKAQKDVTSGAVTQRVVRCIHTVRSRIIRGGERGPNSGSQRGFLIRQIWQRVALTFQPQRTTRSTALPPPFPLVTGPSLPYLRPSSPLASTRTAPVLSLESAHKCGVGGC